MRQKRSFKLSFVQSLGLGDLGASTITRSMLIVSTLGRRPNRAHYGLAKRPRLANTHACSRPPFALHSIGVSEFGTISTRRSICNISELAEENHQLFELGPSSDEPLPLIVAVTNRLGTILS